MKLKPIKICAALVVMLAVAGGSYWQVNFNKDWRQQHAQQLLLQRIAQLSRTEFV